MIAAVFRGPGELDVAEVATPEIGPGEVLVRVGDEVEGDEPVARLYGGRNVERAEVLVREALEVSNEPLKPAPGILDSL